LNLMSHAFDRASGWQAVDEDAAFGVGVGADAVVGPFTPRAREPARQAGERTGIRFVARCPATSVQLVHAACPATAAGSSGFLSGRPRSVIGAGRVERPVGDLLEDLS
jgi:hypothetical protein